MQTIHFFTSVADAQAYRKESGQGGFVFASEDQAILFPFGMTPAAIFTHQATKGLSGKLY